MRYTTRLLAFCAATAIVLTGCAAGDTGWVYEHEGERMPAGVYIAYQMQALDQAQSMLYDQNANNADFVMPDKLADALKLELEGVTMEQWVNDQAQQYARTHYIVEREGERLDLSLSTEELEMLHYNVDSVWDQYGDIFEKQYGVAKSSWFTFQRSELLRSRLFEGLYGEGGEREVSAEELRGIFARDYAKADVLAISKLFAVEEGEDLEAANAERRSMAEGYLERLRGGESLEEVEYDYRVATAAESTKESVVKKAPGSLATIFYRDEAAYYQAGLVDAVFAAGTGTPVLAETDNYFFLILRRDILTDHPQDFDEYRATLAVGEKFDEFEQWLESEATALNLTVNQAALDRYKVIKLQD